MVIFMLLASTLLLYAILASRDFANRQFVGVGLTASNEVRKP